eukprot:COSAG03_NODE_22603_length_289_cov_0.752632_1_plen_73_part_10
MPNYKPGDPETKAWFETDPDVADAGFEILVSVFKHYVSKMINSKMTCQIRYIGHPEYGKGTEVLGFKYPSWWN